MDDPRWKDCDDWSRDFWNELDRKVGLAGLPIRSDPRCRYYGPWVLQLSPSCATSTRGVYVRLADDLSSDLAMAGITYRGMYDLDDPQSIEVATLYFSEPLRSYFSGTTRVSAA